MKTKSGRVIQIPTPEEEAAINAGIASDPENPGWTAEDFSIGDRPQHWGQTTIDMPPISHAMPNFAFNDAQII